MSNPLVHKELLALASGTREEVAFRLLMILAQIEGRDLRSKLPPDQAAETRRWLLESYAACLAPSAGTPG